jgi:hypothetical protein
MEWWGWSCAGDGVVVDGVVVDGVVLVLGLWRLIANMRDIVQEQIGMEGRML